MRVRQKGCVICGATWGDCWREVEGQRMFFCCDVCADEFTNMVSRVKRQTGWKKIDEIQMEGNYRGRVCAALLGSEVYRFFVSFHEDGNIRNFVEQTGY